MSHSVCLSSSESPRYGSYIMMMYVRRRNHSMDYPRAGIKCPVHLRFQEIENILNNHLFLSERPRDIEGGEAISYVKR